MQTSGHRILITGDAKGIGLALAKSFNAAGNKVILVGRDLTALSSAATVLPDAITRVADIANANDRAALVTEFRDITVLVKNACVQCNGEFSLMSTADIDNKFKSTCSRRCYLRTCFYRIHKSNMRTLSITSHLHSLNDMTNDSE